MKYFVTFFGVGLSPKAPGTMGTLAAIPLVWLLTLMGPLAYMALTLILTLVAIVAIDRYEQMTGQHDRKEIVIDEVIGYLVTMTWLPQTWQAYAAGFVLFRILDIWKPLFIGRLDKKTKGGFGVVVDDLAAGIVASIILQVVYNQTTWLGQSLLQ